MARPSFGRPSEARFLRGVSDRAANPAPGAVLLRQLHRHDKQDDWWPEELTIEPPDWEDFTLPLYFYHPVFMFGFFYFFRLLIDICGMHINRRIVGRRLKNDVPFERSIT